MIHTLRHTREGHTGTSWSFSSGVRSSTAPAITHQRQSRSERYPRSIGVPADRAIYTWQ